MTTWKLEIERCSEGDTVVYCTLSTGELDAKFNSGYGPRPLGRPFTAWSEKWVYFPIRFPGVEWVGRVRRDPCDGASRYQGRASSVVPQNEEASE